MHSLEADNNVMLTLSSLAKVKPVCTIIHLEFHKDISLAGGQIKHAEGSTLVFTLDTNECFGIEITDSSEALRQYHYIKYLLEQSGGRLRLAP